MKKALNIAIKDFLINFRDPMGLVLMLVAPLAMTLVFAAAFGGSEGGSTPSGLSHIPVVLVNQDAGSLGGKVIESFQSDNLRDLLEPQVFTDSNAARLLVDHDQVAAVVIIPPDFTNSILLTKIDNGKSVEPFQESKMSTVEVYSNPTRTISAAIIRSVMDSILNQIYYARYSSEVIITQLMMTGRLLPSEASEMEIQVGNLVSDNNDLSRISIQSELTQNKSNQETGFSWLKYSAPSMAILFLMFTLSTSGRSILAERDHGTLSRLLISPTPRSSILFGKMFSTFLVGLAQMTILILANRFIFGFSWGNPIAVTLVTIAVVAAVSGWGLLPASLSRTSGQAAVMGTAITLVFGGIAGNFIPRMALPVWMQKIGYFTPNSWGIESYYNLIQGASLTDVLPAIFWLFLMAVILVFISGIGFRRQYI